MTLLQYNIKLTEEGMKVKPLFLLLHVPKRKQKIEKIKTIVFKIYYFLSIICDVEVIVLNKEHYNDQLDLLEIIDNTKSSYRKTANLKKIADFSPLKKQLNSDINMSSDGDYDDSSDDFNEDTNHSLLINKFNDVIEKADLNCFRKESKYIVLINDETIQGDIYETIETDFISNVLTKFDTKFFHFNYINIKNDKTYRCFLTCLNQFTSDITTTFNDILKNFELYRITEISTKYINIKSKADEWMQELKSTIEDRFDQYTKSYTDKLDDFTLLSKLNDELFTVYPSIDSDFYNECNSILYQIEQRLIKKKEKFISSELNESSNNNLNHLYEIINSQIYWPPEKKDFIEISHVNFLRKEFYCIINALYPKEKIPNALNFNRSILEERIIKDRSNIKKFFANFEKKYELTKDQIVDFSDEMRKGTNYSIRETEKVKEIKVVVESGHLTDAIEQDF